MDDTPFRRPVALGSILAEAERLGFAMSCEDRTGSLLATLATSKPGGRMLELGTGVGASAAWLLDGMDPGARLVSVEANSAVQAIASDHLGVDPRVSFEVGDAGTWLSAYGGPPFDLAFVDCRPGKFQQLSELLGLLQPGALYIGDDLLPQATWPADHQARVDQLLAELPDVQNFRYTTLAWASGLVVGAVAWSTP